MWLLLTALIAPTYAQELQPVWTLTLPFGVPQYAQDRPRRGALYTAVQTVGFGVGTFGAVRLWQVLEAEETEREPLFLAVSSAGMAVGAGGYFMSLADGANVYEARKDELEKGVASWEHERFQAPLPLAMGPAE